MIKNNADFVTIQHQAHGQQVQWEVPGLSRWNQEWNWFWWASLFTCCLSHFQLLWRVAKATPRTTVTLLTGSPCSPNTLESSFQVYQSSETFPSTKYHICQDRGRQNITAQGILTLSCASRWQNMICLDNIKDWIHILGHLSSTGYEASC